MWTWACPTLPYLPASRLSSGVSTAPGSRASKEVLERPKQGRRTGVRGVTGCTLKIASSSGRTCLEHSPSMHEASLPARGRRPVLSRYRLSLPSRTGSCLPSRGVPVLRRHSLLGQSRFPLAHPPCLLLSNSQSQNAWPVSVAVSSPRLPALHLPLPIYPGFPPESRPLKSQLCRRRPLLPFLLLFPFCHC